MSAKLRRWFLKLGEYQFKVVYKKGEENVGADFMTRNIPAQKPTPTEGTAKDTTSNTDPVSSEIPSVVPVEGEQGIPPGEVNLVLLTTESLERYTQLMRDSHDFTAFFRLFTRWEKDESVGGFV
ncbi:MAG: hypothetical protein ACK56F_31410, partial [bacterium]